MCSSHPNKIFGEYFVLLYLLLYCEGEICELISLFNGQIQTLVNVKRIDLYFQYLVAVLKKLKKLAE